MGTNVKQLFQSRMIEILFSEINFKIKDRIVKPKDLLIRISKNNNNNKMTK